MVQPLTGERMRGINGRRNDGAVAKDFCTNFNFLFAPSITERWKISALLTNIMWVTLAIGTERSNYYISCWYSPH